MMPQDVAALIEPGAVPMIEAGATDDAVSLASIAISLRRLADMVPQGTDFHSINNAVEQIGWNAGRAFQGGMRTDR